MKLFEILIPCSSNDGEKFCKKHHKGWDKYVQNMAGGLTILKPAKGKWKSHGIFINEDMIPVRIACTDNQIMKILNFTADYYEQNAIMVYEISSKVLIKEF